MKFTCEKKVLIDAVSNVSKAISEKAPFPALAGMKLMLNKNELELTGYNMEIGIRTTVSVESSDMGQCIIDAGLFSNMLRKMPEDIVLIEISSNYQVTVSSGVTTFNLVAQKSFGIAFMLYQPVRKVLANPLLGSQRHIFPAQEIEYLRFLARSP